MNTLAYETFSETVLSRMQETLGPEKKIAIRKVLKNNNVSLDGIVIDGKCKGLSPTFYMQEFYDAYMQGTPIEEIVSYVCPYYCREYSEDLLDIKSLDSFDDVKDNIIFKLINRDANEKLLEEVPYFNFLDLAIVFQCVAKNGENGVASIMIRSEMLDSWEVEKSALYEAAIRNTKRLFGIEIKELQEVIVDMILNESFSCQDEMPEELRKELIEDIRRQIVRFPIYVMSNRRRVNGAVCMLYREIGIFAEQIEDDLFIIPSSIHEVLLIPSKEQVGVDDLLEILHEVNRDEVLETDYLSDKIYFYSREEKRIFCSEGM